MPLVISVRALDDGFEIVTTNRGTITFTSADLTGAQKQQTPAELEAGLNTFLTSKLTEIGAYAAVHLTSVVPLRGVALVSDTPITGEWWL